MKALYVSVASVLFSSLAFAGPGGGPGAPITRIVDFTKDGVPVRASQLERLDNGMCVSRHPVTFGAVVYCPSDPDLYIPKAKAREAAR